MNLKVNIHSNLVCEGISHAYSRPFELEIVVSVCAVCLLGIQRLLYKWQIAKLFSLVL